MTIMAEKPQPESPDPDAINTSTAARRPVENHVAASWTATHRLSNMTWVIVVPIYGIPPNYQ